MMSSHLALPREGDLKELFHIFAYVRKYHNSEMVFNPSDPVVYERQFEEKIGLHLNLVHTPRKNCLRTCQYQEGLALL